mmetsp:Transcript_11040/g.41231  ORF Transcript_11040/g.41231 Transcript_11040/m.41231 type:complete len:274 (+) Transcript_11040:1320-2141(+)
MDVALLSSTCWTSRSRKTRPNTAMMSSLPFTWLRAALSEYRSVVGDVDSFQKKMRDRGSPSCKPQEEMDSSTRKRIALESSEASLTASRGVYHVRMQEMKTSRGTADAADSVWSGSTRGAASDGEVCSASPWSTDAESAAVASPAASSPVAAGSGDFLASAGDTESSKAAFRFRSLAGALQLRPSSSDPTAGASAAPSSDPASGEVRGAEASFPSPSDGLDGLVGISHSFESASCARGSRIVATVSSGIHRTCQGYRPPDDRLATGSRAKPLP